MRRRWIIYLPESALSRGVKRWSEPAEMLKTGPDCTNILQEIAKMRRFAQIVSDRKKYAIF